MKPQPFQLYSKYWNYVPQVLIVQLRQNFKSNSLILQLAKRTERRQEAQKELDKAEEAGDAENIDKFSRRLVSYRQIYDRIVNFKKPFFDMVFWHFSVGTSDKRAQ